MEKVTIGAEVRDAGDRHKLRATRQSGKVPAVLYGGGGETIPLQVTSRKLVPILGREARHHTLFQLKVAGGEETLATVAEAQWHPVRGTLTHLDFKRVLRDQKIRLPLSIKHVGDPKGVKLEGGSFEVVQHEVTVECLPEDLPEELVVDISDLELGQYIRVSNLQNIIGEKVHIIQDSHAVIFHIAAPKAEEEEVVPDEGEEATDPEVAQTDTAPEEAKGSE